MGKVMAEIDDNTERKQSRNAPGKGRHKIFSTECELGGGARAWTRTRARRSEAAAALPRTTARGGCSRLASANRLRRTAFKDSFRRF